MSRKGRQQKRILMLTNRAMYNISKGMLMEKYKCGRRIEFEEIEKVSTCTATNQSIIHLVEGYDYHYFSDRIEQISDVLESAFRKVCTHKKLKREDLQSLHIESCRYSLEGLDLVSEVGGGRGKQKRNSKDRKLKRLSVDELMDAIETQKTEFIRLPEEVLSLIFTKLSLRNAASLMLAHSRLYRIGKKYSRHWAACRGCSCPLFHKKQQLVFDGYPEILSHDGRLVATRDLPEGIRRAQESLCLRDLDQNALILFGGYYRSMFKRDIDYKKFQEFFDERVVYQLFCKCCGLYLGFKIDTSKISLDVTARMEEPGFPVNFDLLGPDDVVPLDDLYTLLGRYSEVHYLTESYLCWFDAEKEAAQWKYFHWSQLRCQHDVKVGRNYEKCNNLLGSSKDAVCQHFHTHDVGEGEELAIYMSKVAKDNVEFGEEEAAYLSVGPMYYRDMCCKKCKHVVGWKFEKVIEEGSDWKPRNATYQGRYGIVESAVIEKEGDEIGDIPDFVIDLKGICKRKGVSYSSLKADVQYWATRDDQASDEEDETFQFDSFSASITSQSSQV